jgi:hypothetical protein
MVTIRRGLLLALAVSSVVSAQPATRRAASLATLLAHPSFYHLRAVVVAGTLNLENDGSFKLTDGERSLRVVMKENPPNGLSEVRGEFWDLGRMNADDPRLRRYDLRKTFQIDPDGPWPQPGAAVALLGTSAAASTVPTAPTIRALVLFPSRYVDQTVTVVGQYDGRNLQGDLPNAPANSRYDFVIRSADAAIWVSHVRPRGKDFELALDGRIDTGRWLEVTGTFQQGRGLQWIAGTEGSLRLAKPPTEVTTTELAPVRVPAAPPPEVVFSAPIEAEIDVGRSATVRVQFSRDIDPSTFKGRIRVRLIDPNGGGSEPSELPSSGFATEYQAAKRVLEIKFANELEGARKVQVDLLEGIHGTDGQPLSPWTLTFNTAS